MNIYVLHRKKNRKLSDDIVFKGVDVLSVDYITELLCYFSVLPEFLLNFNDDSDTPVYFMKIPR